MPEETVVVRNMQDGPTVIGSRQNPNDYVMWEAAGDPNGDDVKFLSGELASSPGFRTALARGILVIEESETDETVVDALKKQVDAYKRRTESAKTSTEGLLEERDTRDAVMLECVGPNSRANGKCGQPVTVKADRKGEEAPLCHVHKDLANEYFAEISATPAGDRVDWVRTKVERPRTTRANTRKK